MSVKRVQVVDQHEVVRQQRPGQPAALAATEGADEERPDVAGYSMGVLAHIGPRSTHVLTHVIQRQRVIMLTVSEMFS